MASSNHLQLLDGWFSPFALRVKIALNIKSVKYENIEETFYPKSQFLLQLNPVHKKIPVLLHRDKPICESRIIVEYIDEVWNYGGPTILPTDAYDRAMARFWATYIDDKFFVAMKKAAGEEDEEARKPYLKELDEALVTMEGELQKCYREGKGFFEGEEIGLVDITFGSLLGWLGVIESLNGRKMIVEEKHPCLVKWAETFKSDPNVKGLIPEAEQLIEFSKAIKMKRKNAASAK